MTDQEPHGNNTNAGPGDDTDPAVGSPRTPDASRLADDGVEERPDDARPTVGDVGNLAIDQQLINLRREHDDLQERFVRVSADYKNYVRRTAQNIDSARDLLLMDIAKTLVTVLDHFDRALEMDPQTTSAQSLLEGVQIVRDELLRSLERFGIQRLNVRAGDVFDPNRHQALLRQPTEGVAPDHVASQLQPGYILGDKTVRPAQVSVAE